MPLMPFCIYCNSPSGLKVSPTGCVCKVCEKKLRQEWKTPNDFYGVVDKEFNFTLDAAATGGNRKCVSYISKEEDALKNDWWVRRLSKRRIAWCNPGFSKMMPWVVQGFRQAHKWNATVVMMGLVAPSTKWYAFAVRYASEIRLLAPRVQFVAPKGIKQSSNARENALFIFRRLPFTQYQKTLRSIHYLPAVDVRTLRFTYAKVWRWQWKEGK